MNGRKRTVQIKFRVTEEERAFIEQKMQLVPTRNMEAYLRKMAIDGYGSNEDFLYPFVNRVKYALHRLTPPLNRTGRKAEVQGCHR